MGDWGPLGEVLDREGSDRNRANVKDLVAHAKDLLKLVRETFPTYTMHDEQHAENVIGLMGKLAAPRIERMTPLEAALLILAAYFHDTGMAYTEQERNAVGEDEHFQAFLDGDDEAYLATRSNGGVPPLGVLTQYYRSRHADRVWHHLEECDPSWLTWDGNSIIEPLATVSQSHNEPTAHLREERFKKNYRQKADLRFCAILLRLADILDLDRTRSPRVVHSHLGLARHNTPESAISDTEWQKHLAAGGFEFPERPAPNYAVQFVADPTNPGVEHDLRSFLAVIEEELQQCRSVVDLCDDRWRPLPLPAEIDTSAITSHGYKYGEFRFELDRHAVLELFTGEQLYDDPYAFLRELLQNAFDATNARAHLFGHESTGIHVTCWEDAGGYVWVRVDDDGIGMDEDALRKYFLRIGRSYYRSAEFEADSARRGRKDRSFGAISRFGIGVLSCFMVGDRVELSSRRQAAEGAKILPIRLSINRRDDYFVLQEQDRPTRRGTSLPSRNGPEEAFRRRPGTSIAVRIDPNRAMVDLPTAIARVESYVFAPPVPVFVNGERVALETTRLVTEPLLPATETRRFKIADLKQDRGDFIPGLREKEIAVVAIPLD
ncbi:MAG: ATP-binding protein, partial [Actinomycetota bacterium]|nr:ATP-binding protein [Actinomycetota bacterium]